MTKKIEVFASEALPGELEEFPDIKRGWGTTKESTGGIPPMKWFNAIQKRTDETINSILEKNGATLYSYVSELSSIETPEVGDIIIVKSFSNEVPYGGGLFVCVKRVVNKIDNWVYFNSSDEEFMWMRYNGEKDRTILNSGAKEKEDITDRLTLASKNGYTIYQDNDFDVTTRGGIILEKGICIVGDELSSGSIVLTPTDKDEIFNPSVDSECWFIASNSRFKSVSCISNTPYVVGISRFDSRTKLKHISIKNCTLKDIGIGADMLYGSDVKISITGNDISLSKDMSDKIISTGRRYMRGVVSTYSGYSDKDKLDKTKEIIGKINNSKTTVKIVIFGDSTVDGYGTSGWSENPVDSNGSAIGNSNHNLQSPNSWATQLDSKLKAINSNISVYNAGYGRKAIQDGWAIDNYDSAITNNKHYGKCDYCFIAFGLNDRARSGWDAEIYKSKYIELINFIRSKGTEPVVITSDPTNRKDGGPSFSEYRDDLISLQREIATESECAIIDMFSYMSTVDNWTKLQADGIHFGDKGNEYKSEFIVDLFKLGDKTFFSKDSPRYGSSLIANNHILTYMPSLSNQDLCKFTGMFKSQKIFGNYFKNKNLKSYAEVDCYSGVSNSSFSSNTLENSSAKFMSQENSGTKEYRMVTGLNVVGNSFFFHDGSVIDYGVYFKCDVSTFSSNSIVNKQSLPAGQFIAIWCQSERGQGGYLGSENPVGLNIIGNTIDIQCPDYNGQYWRPFESPSVNYASVISGNVFIGGSLRELAGNLNILSSNSFINVSFGNGVELRSINSCNSVSKIKDGVINDGRETSVKCEKLNGVNSANIIEPWLSDDRGEWVLNVTVRNSKNLNNWQTFHVSANLNPQTIKQSSGRIPMDISDNDLKTIVFNLNKTSSGMTLTSISSDDNDVYITYKWVLSMR